LTLIPFFRSFTLLLQGFYQFFRTFDRVFLFWLGCPRKNSGQMVTFKKLLILINPLSISFRAFCMYRRNIQTFTSSIKEKPMLGRFSLMDSCQRSNLLFVLSQKLELDPENILILNQLDQLWTPTFSIHCLLKYPSKSGNFPFHLAIANANLWSKSSSSLISHSSQTSALISLASSPVNGDYAFSSVLFLSLPTKKEYCQIFFSWAICQSLDWNESCSPKWWHLEKLFEFPIS